MKTIMLSCAAGMSTSLLVTKMQQAAKKDNYEVKIFACAAAEAPKHLKDEEIDCVLLGPQVSYMKDDFAKKIKATGKNIPLGVMDMQSYGTMNGEKILKQAKSLMGE